MAKTAPASAIGRRYLSAKVITGSMDGSLAAVFIRNGIGKQ